MKKKASETLSWAGEKPSSATAVSVKTTQDIKRATQVLTRFVDLLVRPMKNFYRLGLAAAAAKRNSASFVAPIGVRL